MKKYACSLCHAELHSRWFSGGMALLMCPKCPYQIILPWIFMVA